MLSRINILKIIVDHFGTLRSLNQKSNNIYYKDFILFILVPFGISTYLVFKKYTFEEQLGELIAAISILGGFLFNLLAIIYSQLDNMKNDAESEENELKSKFVKEIHINISFCIVLSLFIIISLLLTTISIPEFDLSWIIKKLIIWINYFLLALFFLSLLMVVNRVYILLKKN